MKNKNLILLLAAGAAYWYFFIYKKKLNNELPVTSPGFPSQPGEPAQPGQPAPVMTAPAIKSESVTIVDEIKQFTAPERKLQYEQDGVFQTYYVNQVSGVKKMGVPFTI
jgi:hypothetical protein